MATLDDKLLGEKLHYYCSSSEDEGEDKESTARESVPPVPSEAGASINTGPKGVIKDWQRYKQLEREERAEQEAEKLALAKRLALTCRTDKEDQEAKEREENVDAEFEALLDDDLLQSFIKKRMQEMVDNQSAVSSKRFGNMVDLATGEDFLTAVDKEDKGVSVIIFIYENDVAGCNTSYHCLKLIAKDYPHVKFCRIRASVVPLSKQFKDSGVPAIQGWRGGELLASLVRITDSLGEDFFMSDLESYLIESGLLTDKSLVPKVIRGPANHAGENDDSE